MDRFINILAVVLLDGDMIILCKTTFIKLYFSIIRQYTFEMILVDTWTVIKLEDLFTWNGYFYRRKVFLISLCIKSFNENI